jgi:hypothetical protein
MNVVRPSGPDIQLPPWLQLAVTAACRRNRLFIEPISFTYSFYKLFAITPE